MKKPVTTMQINSQGAFPTANERVAKHEPMIVDMQVQQSSRDCLLYTWDREHACLRVNGVHPAEPGLPADQATFMVEGELAVPVFLIASFSSPPGTFLQGRLLGALRFPLAKNGDGPHPTDGWTFIATMVEDSTFTTCESPTLLPQPLHQALEAFVCGDRYTDSEYASPPISWLDASAAAQLVRETRLLLKRQQRNRASKKHWLKQEEALTPVAWRAVEGLNDTLRGQVQQAAFLHGEMIAPHSQAERLIRFVLQRFQHVLAHLLHESEQVLAFVERPLLRHGLSLPGFSQWRSNEGVFLVTYRQILWLRDCFTPGATNFLSGGYIARMVPIERLQQTSILPPGKVPAELQTYVGMRDSPYLHLILEVVNCSGSEVQAIAFPHSSEAEKALARVTGLFDFFMPCQNGQRDRRVRCLPTVDAWIPQGAEAEHLARPGGIVPAAIAEHLEACLSEYGESTQEQVLASALVPALADYKSPARLIALTWRELIVIDDGQRSILPRAKTQRVPGEYIHRYDIEAISSVQLQYTLVGSTLMLVEPQCGGQPLRHVFPFHSPAIARFLPLFTRLSALLRMPCIAH